MNFLGNIRCPKCNLETRFLIEDEESEELLLLGDKIDHSYKGHSECDYCQEKIEIHVIEKEKVISAFLTKEEFRAYESGKKEIKKAEDKIGMKIEESKKLKQFDKTVTIDFNQMPFSKNKKIKLENKTWTIEKIIKKENIEKDPNIRIDIQNTDEYWYKIKSKEDNEERWLIVQDDIKNNAVITQDFPVYKDNEKLHDITDGISEQGLMMEKIIGENFKMEVYKKLSGINVIVSLLDEEEQIKEVEFNGFGDSFEEAVGDLEEIITPN